jgi:hypothetical protein
MAHTFRVQAAIPYYWVLPGLSSMHYQRYIFPPHETGSSTGVKRPGLLAERDIEYIGTGHENDSSHLPKSKSFIPAKDLSHGGYKVYPRSVQTGSGKGGVQREISGWIMSQFVSMYSEHIMYCTLLSLSARTHASSGCFALTSHAKVSRRFCAWVP